MGAWSRMVRFSVVAAMATALALPAPAAARGDPGGESPAVGERSAGTVGSQTQPVPSQPRFVVEARGFTADDESGYDRWGSDEVFGVFWENRGHITATSVYGDIDSGDFQRFGNHEQCIYPQQVLDGPTSVYAPLQAPGDTWECDERGAPGPINLQVRLYEDDDDGWPEFNPYHPHLHLDEDDDLIGWARRDLSAALLAAAMPRVGADVQLSIRLGGPCGPQGPGEGCVKNWLSSSGPEYTLRLVIRRVQDGPLPVERVR
jgi:hypothetical protein